MSGTQPPGSASPVRFDPGWAARCSCLPERAPPSSPPPPPTLCSSPEDGQDFLQHEMPPMDTLAGIAEK